MRALVFHNSMARTILTKLASLASPQVFTAPTAPMLLEEIPEPALPAEDWLVIQTRYCGICGSDTKQVFLKGSVDNPMTSLISFPQVLGHEVVGRVVRVGSRVRHRRVGDRVVLNPWLSCGPRGIEPPCEACRHGDFSICENFRRGHLAPGIHTGNSSTATGGFAPLVPAHESMAIPVPDDVSDEAAVLADPFSVSLHGILKRPPAAGRPVLVWGCGTLGLCAIALLSRLYPGSRVYAVARFPHQKRLAQQLGAVRVFDHAPTRSIIEGIAAEIGTDLLEPWKGLPMLNGGVDVVYDTVGLPETVEVSVRVTRPRGAIVITGVEAPARFEWTPLYFKEIELIGSNAFGFEEFEGSRRHAMEIYFDLVRSRRVDVTPIITHRFGLESYREAFAACWDQGASGAVKVVFDYAPGNPRHAGLPDVAADGASS